MITALGSMLPLIVFAMLIALFGMGWVLLRKPEEAAELPEEESPTESEPVEEQFLVQTPLGPKERRLDAVVENLAAPKEAGEREALRQQLIQAGYRGRRDVSTYLALRIGLALLMPLFLLVAFRPSKALIFALILIAGANIGYYVPYLIVQGRRTARQDAILKSFPNALDMLVSCLEAGLGLDASFMRVARELKPTAPELAGELEILTQEANAGMPRLEVLRRLADRTGVNEVTSLVNVLAHAEKYGSGVADSLRAHAQHVRKRRALDAEKRAAKAAPKLTVVMVMFILPALFAVVLGPAVVNVIQVLIPTMRSGMQ